MSENEDVLSELEAAMDQLILVTSQMQRLAIHLVGDPSMDAFIQRYNQMTEQLLSIEKTIHRMGLDKESESFLRIDKKLRDFEEDKKKFLKKMQQK